MWCISSFARGANCCILAVYWRNSAPPSRSHIRSIKNNVSGFPVTKHFNPPSLCNLNCVFCNGSTKERLEAEHRRIHKLGTLQPAGLNTKLDFFLVQFWLFLFNLFLFSSCLTFWYWLNCFSQSHFCRCLTLPLTDRYMYSIVFCLCWTIVGIN